MVLTSQIPFSPMPEARKYVSMTSQPSRQSRRGNSSSRKSNHLRRSSVEFTEDMFKKYSSHRNSSQEKKIQNRGKISPIVKNSKKHDLSSKYSQHLSKMSKSRDKSHKSKSSRKPKLPKNIFKKSSRDIKPSLNKVKIEEKREISTDKKQIKKVRKLRDKKIIKRDENLSNLPLKPKIPLNIFKSKKIKRENIKKPRSSKSQNKPKNKDYTLEPLNISMDLPINDDNDKIIDEGNYLKNQQKQKSKNEPQFINTNTQSPYQQNENVKSALNRVKTKKRILNFQQKRRLKNSPRKEEIQNYQNFENNSQDFQSDNKSMISNNSFRTVRTVKSQCPNQKNNKIKSRSRNRSKGLKNEIKLSRSMIENSKSNNRAQKSIKTPAKKNEKQSKNSSRPFKNRQNKSKQIRYSNYHTSSRQKNSTKNIGRGKVVSGILPIDRSSRKKIIQDRIKRPLFSNTASRIDINRKQKSIKFKKNRNIRTTPSPPIFNTNNYNDGNSNNDDQISIQSSSNTSRISLKDRNFLDYSKSKAYKIEDDIRRLKNNSRKSLTLASQISFSKNNRSPDQKHVSRNNSICSNGSLNRSTRYQTNYLDIFKDRKEKLRRSFGQFPPIKKSKRTKSSIKRKGSGGDGGSQHVQNTPRQKTKKIDFDKETLDLNTITPPVHIQSPISRGSQIKRQKGHVSSNEVNRKIDLISDENSISKSKSRSQVDLIKQFNASLLLYPKKQGFDMDQDVHSSPEKEKVDIKIKNFAENLLSKLEIKKVDNQDYNSQNIEGNEGSRPSKDCNKLREDKRVVKKKTKKILVMKKVRKKRV